jgi:hypothetical protein
MAFCILLPALILMLNYDSSGTMAQDNQRNLQVEGWL